MKIKANVISVSLTVLCFFGFVSSVPAQSDVKIENAVNTDQNKLPSSGETTKEIVAGLQHFDFLVGEWSVRHRRIDAKSQKWVEFDGTCSNRKLTNGWANLEEHNLNSPSGAYNAVAMRSYDSKAQQWAIWWLDSRYPSSIMPPVKGRFENNIGTFYAELTGADGRQLRVRFIWSEITANSARWEQALSFDAGKTWETNWIMNFQRVP